MGVWIKLASCVLVLSLGILGPVAVVHTLNGPKVTNTLSPMQQELKAMHDEKAVINQGLTDRLKAARDAGDTQEVERLLEEEATVIAEYKARADSIYRKHGKNPPGI